MNAIEEEQQWMADGVRTPKRTRPVLGLFTALTFGRGRDPEARLLVADGPHADTSCDSLPLRVLFAHGWRFCSVPPPSTTYTSMTLFFLEFVGKDAP